MLQKIQKAMQSLLDPAGKVSMGRFLTLISAAMVFSWDTANLVFAWKFNHLHPDMRLPLLPDVATMLGQTAFVTAFYGLTKWQEYKIAGLPPQ